MVCGTTPIFVFSILFSQSNKYIYYIKIVLSLLNVLHLIIRYVRFAQTQRRCPELRLPVCLREIDTWETHNHARCSSTLENHNVIYFYFSPSRNVIRQLWMSVLNALSNMRCCRVLITEKRSRAISVISIKYYLSWTRGRNRYWYSLFLFTKSVRYEICCERNLKQPYLQSTQVC